VIIIIIIAVIVTAVAERSWCRWWPRSAVVKCTRDSCSSSWRWPCHRRRSRAAVQPRSTQGLL